MVDIVDDHDWQPIRLHPEPGWPRFIPRLGHRQQRLAPLLAAEGVTMTVSPLYFMGHNPELALFTAAQPPLGLALDPCTHLRQLPAGRRAPAFRALPFGSSTAGFDPEQDPFSEADLYALVTASLDLQRGRGATLLLTPFHLVGAIGTRGRELDLNLARAAVAHFRSQRMDEPAELAELPVSREIYTTIAVRHELLASPSALHALAEAYLALEADGFWVKLESFNERASRKEIRCGASFLAALASDERPVVSCGPGQLHLGLLVNDLSTSVGLSEGERFRFPAFRERPEWHLGRSRTAYHPKYLHSFRVGGDGATRAFSASPCRCNRHPAAQPPTGKLVEEHAAVVRAIEAREALEGEVGERREWLLATAAMASHLAHDADVEYTQAAVLEAVFEGIDAEGAGGIAAAG